MLTRVRAGRQREESERVGDCRRYMSKTGDGTVRSNGISYRFAILANTEPLTRLLSDVVPTRGRVTCSQASTPTVAVCLVRPPEACGSALLLALVDHDVRHPLRRQCRWEDGIKKGQRWCYLLVISSLRRLNSHLEQSRVSTRCRGTHGHKARKQGEQASMVHR